jgi:predicted ATPase
VPFDVKPLTADIPGAFVAREREMSLLTGYRREAARGCGRIVMIAGDAGVGKSSLLRQFELDADGGRAISALARCV